MEINKLKPIVLGIVAALSQDAYSLSLADSPLFLTTPVEPNINMVLDDSGSMSWGYMPDSVYDDSIYSDDWTRRQYHANKHNSAAYNPFATYLPPVRSDGVTYSTSFGAAYHNGFDTSQGSVNLASGYKAAVQYLNHGNISGGAGGYNYVGRHPASYFSSGLSSGKPAYYFYFYSDNPSLSRPSNCTATVSSQEADEDCYIYAEVGMASDITPKTSAEQRQNFANWYSFYRTRSLTAMSGATQAVAGLPANSARLSWIQLGDDDCKTYTYSATNKCRGYGNTNHENRMRPIDAASVVNSGITHRTDFFDYIRTFNPFPGTPLRTALKTAGEYFKSSGVNSPYAQDPYNSLGTEYSCRRNYTVMYTDGYWNDGSPSGFNNNDNTAIANLNSTGFSFASGQRPYADNTSKTLADIAFYYWATDLRAGGSSLTNNVSPVIKEASANAVTQFWNPKNDTASWQHMTTFTIGLGLQKTFDNLFSGNSDYPRWSGSTYAGDYPALLAGTKGWPSVSSGNAKNVYDLWHAAINSRGQFFSADDPASLQGALNSIFTTIINSTASSSSAAANSTSISSGTVLYQAQFKSSDWSGSFNAFPVQSNGGLGAKYWDAGVLLTDAPTSGRNILSYNGSTGISFSDAGCTSVSGNTLSNSQVWYLNRDQGLTLDNRCADRVAWLRGDSVSGFRSRSVTLGDIVNSDPVFSYKEDYGYSSLPGSAAGQSSYNAYKSAKASKPPMIYVGANDGMLHGFRSDVSNGASGQELFAFIPNSAYDHIGALMDTNYGNNHKYYVDGTVTVNDAYISIPADATEKWRTILVGGLNKGGKSIYALDISNPDSMTADNVMWEFTDGDLGYTYSQPKIGRLNDGSWVAIFGNGYNSASGQASLYIVSLSTGTLISKLTVNGVTDNGLSTPALYDADGDKTIDYVYAGDLLGNLWKFDLTSTTVGDWGVWNKVASNNAPLFSSGATQPITEMPVIGGNTAGGVNVYFGTGRYLQSSDISNVDEQTFYAVWDTMNNSNKGTVAKTSLIQQSVSATGTVGSSDTRTTSTNSVSYGSTASPGNRGWYINLPTAGERVISSAFLKNAGGVDRVIFITAIPSQDLCNPGSDSWLMELMAQTGGAPAHPVFDLDGDGAFGDGDNMSETSVVSGVKSSVGMAKSIVWLDNPTSNVAIKQLPGISTNIQQISNLGDAPVVGSVNRMSWQQLQ